MYKPYPDRFGVANNCDPATVDYFIKVFGYQEALELSNIDDPTSNTIDAEKIQVALNDAAVLINNYIETAPPQGKLLIAGSYRRTQATLARGYLDSLRPRTHVMDAFQSALQQLELWANKLQPTAVMRYQEAYRYWNSDCGLVKSTTMKSRQFTQDSMHRWETLYGANDEWNRIPRKQSNVTKDTEVGMAADINQNVVIPMSNELMEMNQLVSSLEATRALSNFENTQKLADQPPPEDGDLLTADSTGDFDNLQPGDEYV
jgi:phage gp36-like protein